MRGTCEGPCQRQGLAGLPSSTSTAHLTMPLFLLRTCSRVTLTPKTRLRQTQGQQLGLKLGHTPKRGRSSRPDANESWQQTAHSLCTHWGQAKQHTDSSTLTVRASKAKCIAGEPHEGCVCSRGSSCQHCGAVPKQCCHQHATCASHQPTAQLPTSSYSPLSTQHTQITQSEARQALCLS